MLNLYDAIKPRFVKQYADLKTETFNALTSYKTDVSLNNFPSNNHSWSMDNLELKKLKKYFGEIKKAKI